jgi:hypothetical protein
MTKLSCFVIIRCTMFLLCVDMYIGIVYPITEFWSDWVSNTAASHVYGQYALGFGFRLFSQQRLGRLLPKPYIPYTHRQLPTQGAYATPCIALVCNCDTKSGLKECNTVAYILAKCFLQKSLVNVYCCPSMSQNLFFHNLRRKPYISRLSLWLSCMQTRKKSLFVIRCSQ